MIQPRGSPGRRWGELFRFVMNAGGGEANAPKVSVILRITIQKPVLPRLIDFQNSSLLTFL
jgi:hypothetical protein